MRSTSPVPRYIFFFARSIVVLAGLVFLYFTAALVYALADVQPDSHECLRTLKSLSLPRSPFFLLFPLTLTWPFSISLFYRAAVVALLFVKAGAGARISPRRPGAEAVSSGD